jgi:signal transduction histidine kinase
MSYVDKKITAVQQWINELQQCRTLDSTESNSLAVEEVLTDIVERIQHFNTRTQPEQNLSVTAAELETLVQERTTAFAIQQAPLYAHAKRKAVLEERSRLASELHDTISQTLWSVSLITERLPAIWELDQEAGRNSLSTLRQLAQSALVEMRSLFLELRPSALTNAKLGDLIRQLVEIMTNRTGLIFSVSIKEKYPIPPDVQVGLYRVLQEALNNIAHHAAASHVEIAFSRHLRHIDLTIRDNGRGYDPAEIGLGHLGLSIMKDRIDAIGAKLVITSQKGEGTFIKVKWTAPKVKKVKES